MKRESFQFLAKIFGKYVEKIKSNERDFRMLHFSNTCTFQLEIQIFTEPTSIVYNFLTYSFTFINEDRYRRI